MDKSLTNILRNTEPFQTLDENELSCLIRDGEFVEFSNKEIILNQGHSGPGLYLLLHGKVSVTVNAIGAGIVRLTTLSSGQLFGEVNLIEHGLCTATVTAKGKVHCFFLSKQLFDRLSVGYPLMHYRILQALLEVVLTRQRNLREFIQTQNNISFREKVHLAKKLRRPTKQIIKWSLDEKATELSYLFKLFNVSFFSKSEILTLIGSAKVIEASCHYALITADTSQKKCYFILTGCCTIQIPTNTEDINIATLGPNYWLCSTSLMDRSTNLFNIRVLESCRLLEFDTKVLNTLKKEQPRLWYKIHNHLCQFSVSMQKKINTQIVRMSCERNEILNFKQRGEI